MKILDFIPVGRENAMTAKAITQTMELAHERDFTKAVEIARGQGVAICADTHHGYWLPEDRDELDQYTKSLRSRKNSVERTLAGAETALARWPDDRI